MSVLAHARRLARVKEIRRDARQVQVSRALAELAEAEGRRDELVEEKLSLHAAARDVMLGLLQTAHATSLSVHEMMAARGRSAGLEAMADAMTGEIEEAEAACAEANAGVLEARLALRTAENAVHRAKALIERLEEIERRTEELADELITEDRLAMPRGERRRRHKSVSGSCASSATTCGGEPG
jgi:hypothetical protein